MNHMFGGASDVSKLWIHNSGEWVLSDVKLVGHDQAKDITVLAPTNSLLWPIPQVDYVGTGAVRHGQEVYALGYAAKYSYSASAGLQLWGQALTVSRGIAATIYPDTNGRNSIDIDTHGTVGLSGGLAISQSLGSNNWAILGTVVGMQSMLAPLSGGGITEWPAGFSSVSDIKVAMSLIERNPVGLPITPGVGT